MNFSDPEVARRLILASHDVALEAMNSGNHPFGAVLAGPDGEVLMSQGNESTVKHAETQLARRAFETYDQDFLWQCCLATNFEPCAMCAGTIYWANIGNVLFGAKEIKLLELTGNHPENPTLTLPCRSIFAAGQKDIHVLGPYPELEDTLVAPHLEFWK